MSSHNTASQLTNTIGDAGGRRFAWFSGTPTASAAGFNKGCIAIDETNGIVYVNTGTVASATWTVVGTQT